MSASSKRFNNYQCSVCLTAELQTQTPKMYRIKGEIDNSTETLRQTIRRDTDDVNQIFNHDDLTAA